MKILAALILSAAMLGAGDDAVAKKLNRFARIYAQFAAAYNAGKFDVRLARELSHEWHEVENSGEWTKEK